MRLNEIFDSLTDFQKSFGAGHSKYPRFIDPKTAELRYKLMEEENNEYLEAAKNNDMVEIADALGDKLYILAGTIIEHGLQDIIPEVFREIHRSNMSKLDESGKPIVNGENGVFDETRPLGKILKSPNYFAPNLKPIVKRGLIKANIEKLNEIQKEIRLTMFDVETATTVEDVERLKAKLAKLEEDLEEVKNQEQIIK